MLIIVIFSSCFQVTSETISPLSGTHRSLNLNQTTPETGPPGSVSQIFLSPDGKNVVVSVKGTSASNPGYLAVWDIDSSNSTSPSLSKDFRRIQAPTGGQNLFGLVQVKGEQALIVADPAVGYNILDLSGQNRSASYSVDGQMAICWVAHSEKTGNYYFIDPGANRVTEVAVDGSLKGSVVSVSPDHCSTREYSCISSNFTESCPRKQHWSS
jgi:hypothetical protein